MFAATQRHVTHLDFSPVHSVRSPSNCVFRQVESSYTKRNMKWNRKKTAPANTLQINFIEQKYQKIRQGFKRNQISGRPTHQPGGQQRGLEAKGKMLTNPLATISLTQLARDGRKPEQNGGQMTSYGVDL